MNRWITFFFLTTLLSHTAMFNRINTVINTPAAWQGTIGQFELGASWAPYTLNNQSFWEDDYYLNYTLTDFLSLGVTRLNGNDVAGNLQMLMARDLLFPRINLAMGIDNIIAKDKASTFDSLQEKYANNMSLYLVMSYRMDQWEFSGGLGDGRLSNYYNPYAFLVSNLFYSASYYFSKGGENSGRLSFEFDSRDFNCGLFLPLSSQIDLKIALTQLPFRTGNNPNYGDIPYENLSVGISYKMNLFSFYGEEYSKFSSKLKDINDKGNIIGERYAVAIANSEKTDKIVNELTLEKNSLKTELTLLISDLKREKERMKNEMKSLRDVIESEGFRNTQSFKEDIMRLYYKALRYYYEEKYFEAIEELTKAKMLNDKIPEIHIRLGSIYWTLGLRDEALESWRIAYGLDKNNDMLNTFLRDHQISFEETQKTEVTK